MEGQMDGCRLGNQVFNNTAGSAATAALMEAVERTPLTVAVRSIRNASFSATQILQHQRTC